MRYEVSALGGRNVEEGRGCCRLKGWPWLGRGCTEPLSPPLPSTRHYWLVESGVVGRGRLAPLQADISSVPVRPLPLLGRGVSCRARVSSVPHCVSSSERLVPSSPRRVLVLPADLPRDAEPPQADTVPGWVERRGPHAASHHPAHLEPCTTTITSKILDTYSNHLNLGLRCYHISFTWHW